LHAKVPIFGRKLLGQTSGNLTQGIQLTVAWKEAVSGTEGMTLDEKNILLSWDLQGFDQNNKNQKVISQIP
jgi:hypothetical protein